MNRKCIVFKAITENKTDEILAVAPYFTEYKVFVTNACATFKVVKADEKNFQINFNELTKMLNPNTKAIIINSPNNPSGVIYSKESLEKLAKILKEKEKEYNHPIYIIYNKPYKKITFTKK